MARASVSLADYANSTGRVNTGAVNPSMSLNSGTAVGDASVGAPDSCTSRGAICNVNADWAAFYDARIERRQRRRSGSR